LIFIIFLIFNLITFFTNTSISSIPLANNDGSDVLGKPQLIKVSILISLSIVLNQLFRSNSNTLSLSNINFEFPISAVNPIMLKLVLFNILNTIFLPKTPLIPVSKTFFLVIIKHLQSHLYLSHLITSFRHFPHILLMNDKHHPIISSIPLQFEQ